jgi:hypothetical protein
VAVAVYVRVELLHDRQERERSRRAGPGAAKAARAIAEAARQVATLFEHGIEVARPLVDVEQAARRPCRQESTRRSRARAKLPEPSRDGRGACRRNVTIDRSRGRAGRGVDVADVELLELTIGVMIATYD